MTHNNESTVKETIADHKVAVGVGLATLAAAAAGAYYLYGHEKASQHRRKLKSWTLRMKADVMEQIENLKDINEEAYNNIVNGIAEKYQQLKEVDPGEVAALAARMRMHWKDIQKDITQVTSGTGRVKASTKKMGRKKVSKKQQAKNGR